MFSMEFFLLNKNTNNCRPLHEHIPFPKGKLLITPDISKLIKTMNNYLTVVDI